MTTAATRIGRNGSTRTSGRRAVPIRAMASSMTDSATTCGAILTLATRSPGLDDRAVELGEDLERVEAIDPLQRPDPDVEDAVVGRPQVDPALDRPARFQPLSGNRERETQRGVVLVEFARVEQDDRGGHRR